MKEAAEMATRVRVIEKATGKVVEEMVLTGQGLRGWDLWWAMNGNWQDYREEQEEIEEGAK